MRITVHYLAQLKRLVGIATETVDVDGACNLVDLFEHLCRRHPPGFRALVLDDAGRPHPSLLIFLGNGQVQRDFQDPLPEGAEVTLLTPMSGG